MSEQSMTLFKHQQEGINKILNNGGSGALFWEIGTGKTMGALEIFKGLRAQGATELRLLVICPISLIEGAWGNDIKRFTDFTYLNGHARPVEFNLDTDIYIVNYAALISEIRYAAIHRMVAGHPFMCVIDESSKIKNHRAATTKAALALRNLFRARVVMSGTPAPNDETEYWSQINFIRPGIFHENFYPFRNFYFHLQRERAGHVEVNPGVFYSKDTARKIFQQGWHYDMTDIKRQALMERMAPWCHYARKKDCLDLPDQVDELRMVEMGVRQRQAYYEMKRDLITEIQDHAIVAQLALAKISKLREITSGFAIDDKGQVADIGESPKLKELLDVLDEAGKQQVIIWCQFRFEIEQIAGALAKRGDSVVTLYGETKDKDESVAAFMEGRAQYLVAHPASAGHGLTFIRCSLQVFYSLNYSWELYEQARGRIHRAGQVNKCTYVHLLCPGTIDEVILRVLRAKKDAAEIVYEMIGGRDGS